MNQNSKIKSFYPHPKNSKIFLKIKMFYWNFFIFRLYRMVWIIFFSFVFDDWVKHTISLSFSKYSRMRSQYFAKYKEVMCFVLNYQIHVRNIQFEPFNLISISKYISKSKFIYCRICLLYFWIRENRYFWMNQNSQIKSFSSHPKNSNKFKKINRKFSLLTDFRMNIRLNGSYRYFLT
jgi:hypothetical protein